MSKPQLGRAEFDALCRLLRDTAGLAFDETRRESLAYSVSERLRATGCTDAAAYLSLLDGPQGASERQALLDEVTIPETHFFRNPPQVRALRAFVLPELLRQAAGRRRLRIWSAGCSTGEEPYTVAMLVRELLGPAADWDVKVLATDVSTRALAAARAATYTERSFVMTDPVDRDRWFRREADGWVVRDEVRELVELRHHNLVTDRSPFEPGDVDLILCRNVTIYFSKDTTRALVGRLHTALRDGGYLFLGHAETLWRVNDDFGLVTLGDAFVYRRNDTTERRVVLPDRRTAQEPVPAPERRKVADRRIFRRPAQLLRAAAPAEPVPDPLDAVRAAVRAGRYDEAADLAAEVAAAAPLAAQAYYLHGLALTNLGRDEDALVALRKAVYLDPKDGFAHFLLGGALDRLGERQAAAGSYRAAAQTLGRRPQDSVAAELGGRSVAELAGLCRRLAQAADAARKAEELP